MKRIFIAFLALVLSGCVAIPYPAQHNLDREGLSRFEAGITTKEQVINALGEPLVALTNGSVMFFDATYSNYGLLVAWGIAGPYGGGVGDIAAGDVPVERYRVLVRFDEQNLLKSWKVLKTSADQEWSNQPPPVSRPTLRTVLFPDRRFRQIRYANEGSVFAASSINYSQSMMKWAENSTVFVWSDADEGPFTKIVDPQTSHLGFFDISEDGSTIAIPRKADGQRGSDISIWETRSGELRRLIEIDRPGWWETPAGIYSLTLSRDGKLVAAKSLADVVSVWDTETGAKLGTLADGKRRWWKGFMAFSPRGDALAITGSLRRLVEVWFYAGDTPAFGPINNNYPEAFCSSVDYSDSGSLLALNCHSHVQLWRIKAKPNPSEEYLQSLADFFLLPSYPSEDYFFPSKVKISPDEKEIIVLRGAVIAWDIESQKELWRIEPPELGKRKADFVYDFAITSDGSTVFLTTDAGIYVYDLDNLDDSPSSLNTK